MHQETLENAFADAVKTTVTQALKEDIGSGDITAQLIPEDKQAHARVITREHGIVCGQAWVNEVFKQVSEQLELSWHVQDGDAVEPNQCLFELKGPARAILTGERCALNFLQSLSGTASICQHYAQQVAHTQVKLLDTRKTIPGLRIAQKYAVTQGGCHNHRIGLYDAFLIKENHIMACGSIAAAVEKAHQIAPGKPVEVEVEDFEQLGQAISSGADIVMLDNFDVEQLKQAVAQAQGEVKLEASGGITIERLAAIAETGVDFISIGALTKDCKAMDLSLRLVD